MSFELSKIDWNAISAISTFLAALVALFYQPFLNRRKVVLDTNLRTENGNIHLIYLCITNKGEKPIWIVSGGLLFEDGEKKVVKFMDGDTLPKKLEPSEFIICPTPIMEYNYKIKDLFAKDSLGKFWYLKRKQRKELDKNIRICKDHNPPLVRSKPAEYVERPKPKSKS